MKPGCKFCDKTGLPVLLTRYAIAPAIAQVAKLPDNLKPKLKDNAGNSTLDAPNMGDTCNYTLRILRTGYTYQYTEYSDKSTSWAVYKVLDQGYLYQLSLDKNNPDPKDPKQQDNPSKEVFSCSSIAAEVSLASIVTIPNADKASKVWFAHAEVLWTKDIFSQHKNIALRKKNMQLFDVEAWRKNHKNVKNANPIDDLEKLLAESQLSGNQATAGFGWSQFGFFCKDKAATSNIISNCQALVHNKKYPPAILCLDDPVGMMQELTQLMDKRLDVFQNAPIRKRKLAVSGSIDQIKRAVTEMAERDTFNGAESAQGNMMAMSEGTLLFTEAGRKSYEDAGIVTKEDLEKASNDLWKKKYANRFDEGSKKVFDKKYSEELTSFDNAHIFPLANAHATIFKNSATAIYFDSNHDKNDINTGIAYLNTVTNCLKNIQDKKPCSDELEKQLQAIPGKPENILMNAFTLNNQKLLDKIKEGIDPHAELLHIPWSALSDAFKAAIGMAEEEEKKAAIQLAKILVGYLGAPIMYVINHTIEGTIKCCLPAILGMMSDAPIVKVEITGNMGKFVEHMTKQLMLASGNKNVKDANVLANAVSQEVKKLGIKGVDIKGSKKKTFAILVDEEMLHNLQSKEKMETLMKMTLEERAKYVTQALKAPEQLEKLNLRSTFERFKAPGGQVFVTGISLFFQWLIIGKLNDDVKSALSGDKNEALWRYKSGCWAMGGFVGEAVESFAGGLIKLNFKWMSTLKAVKLIGGIGAKVAGVFAGAILAWFDAKAAVEAGKSGNYGMMILYGISSGAGLAVAILFACCEVVPVIGWVCLVVLVIVTILIDIFHDNNFQKWLDKCLWGREEEKYSEDEETKEFKIALEG